MRDDFKKRLATALEKRDKKAVKAIFNDYGRVIALQNVLGAERQLVTEATNVTKSTERRIRTHFQAMLTSSQLPVTAKFRFGRSKAQQDAYETAVQQKKTYFVGGSTKYQNEKHLDDWKESVESRALCFLALLQYAHVNPSGELEGCQEDKYSPNYSSPFRK